MDVILHIGAHRTATTSMQRYLRCQSAALAADRVAFWGPRRTRTGLFRGILPDPLLPVRSRPVRRAHGRILLNLDRTERRNCDLLIVSDENMSGSVRENLRLGALYIGAGERAARYAAAFGGRVDSLVIGIRDLESYWASALAFGLIRGAGVPSAAALDRLAFGERGWRDVITDLAEAIPGVPLKVLPFEATGGRPEAAYAAMSGRRAPAQRETVRLNAAPNLKELRALRGAAGLPGGDGYWKPFNTGQRAAMRERYRQDLFWLAAGADGLAEPLALPDWKGADRAPPTTTKTRGRSDDSQQRRMAPYR